MKRLPLPILVSLLAVLVLTLPAHAMRWCRADPIISLDGTVVQILVAIPEEYVPYVDGPTKVVIAVPDSVDRQVLMTDAGFNGHGEVVNFYPGVGSAKNGKIPVVIGVQVPIGPSEPPYTAQVPVEVTVIVENAAPVVVQGNNGFAALSLYVDGRLGE